MNAWTYQWLPSSTSAPHDASASEIQTVYDTSVMVNESSRIDLINMMGVLAGWLFGVEKPESGLPYSLFQL